MRIPRERRVSESNGFVLFVTFMHGKTSEKAGGAARARARALRRKPAAGFITVYWARAALRAQVSIYNSLYDPCSGSIVCKSTEWLLDLLF
ncbi:hypothetical protein EVAR_81755_1 [Eumeta japonica]|uniref:Uncharacterized protein n=1 Tax=Eumeta variegata TaxID=151549 RepID=A0A4C1UJ14_EUMVA|nr:hypothetical protein EVAR_81755_1 [Eumeta japonica]